MDPWTLGLIAVIVVGLAVILFGALSDRSKNRRAALEMLAPPRRTIPQFRPDSPAPKYLSELQARRRPEDWKPTNLSEVERERLAQQLKDTSTVEIDAGFVSSDFITDPSSSRSILNAPRILVCSERVESTRELLSVLERFTLSQAPLVIIAPSLSDEVRGTLEVNAIRGTVKLLAVTIEAGGDRQRVADATGAQVRTRSDLQAGHAWPEHLGSCARWVSTPKRSFIIGPAQPTGESR